MGILIKQDDGQLIPYTEVNPGWTHSVFTEDSNGLSSWVIDRNGRVLGLADSEGKPVPVKNEWLNTAQRGISNILYGLKRGNPDALNSLDQLRTRRSVDRNPHNPYAVGSRYAPDDSPDVFIEDGSGKLAPGTPAPDQPPQYGGPLVRRQKLQEAIENSNDSNPWLGGNYGSRRPGWGLVDENPQPQAPVKSAGKPRRVRQGRSRGNLSRSGSNTYATAGTPKGGVVSPATMMRTSGVQPVQAAYGNNAPMGEGFDYTRTYDPMSNSMRPNDSYSYYDPSRNAPSGGDGTDLTLTYDPMTGQMVRR